MRPGIEPLIRQSEKQLGLWLIIHLMLDLMPIDLSALSFCPKMLAKNKLPHACWGILWKEHTRRRIVWLLAGSFILIEYTIYYESNTN
jgi:hypothetical protein